MFSYEVYADDHELWREFCAAYFDAHELSGSDIANLPDEFPSMKYASATFWYVVTEDLDLKGPFHSRDVAQNYGDNPEQ